MRHFIIILLLVLLLFSFSFAVSTDGRNQAEQMTADEVIPILGLVPHPEGGRYRETFRSDESHDHDRASGSGIYFLLRRGEPQSHWHRVDADETWHFYAGDPLELSTSASPGVVTRRVLGSDLRAGQRPQLTVAKSNWQSARTLGEWTLVGCTVTPAFVWEGGGFELAPPDFEP